MLVDSSNTLLNKDTNHRKPKKSQKITENYKKNHRNSQKSFKLCEIIRQKSKKIITNDKKRKIIGKTLYTFVRVIHPSNSVNLKKYLQPYGGYVREEQIENSTETAMIANDDVNIHARTSYLYKALQK